MSQLKIHIFTHGRAELLSLLKENNIQFVEQYPSPGIIVASSALIQIIEAATPIFASLAGVLIAWLKANSKRKIYCRIGNNELNAEGYSVEQLEQILPTVSSITAFQTTPDSIASSSGERPAESGSSAATDTKTIRGKR